MKSAAIMFPVLPGKLGQAKQFAEAVTSRLDEFNHAMTQVGLAREDWYLQTTPHGDMMIVVMEGEDPLKTMHAWAASQNAYDTWFKTQAGELSGVDFDQPVPGLPEHIFSWRRS